MAKRRAPKPVRLGGKAPESGLLFSLLRSISLNLGNVLRVALVLGFVAVLNPLLNKIEIYVAAGNSSPELPSETLSAPDLKDLSPEPQRQPTNPLLDDGWKFAMNCTRKEFRDVNFDACFPDGTDVYERPKADDDEGGFLLMLEEQTLYAAR